MSETLPLIASWAAGAALALIFFGGLWWTIPKGMTSSHPTLWFAVSLLLRVSVAVGGIYQVGHGDWIWMAACLVGFAMTRPLVLWSTRHLDRRVPSRRYGRNGYGWEPAPAPSGSSLRSSEHDGSSEAGGRECT